MSCKGGQAGAEEEQGESNVNCIVSCLHVVACLLGNILLVIECKYNGLAFVNQNFSKENAEGIKLSCFPLVDVLIRGA